MLIRAHTHDFGYVIDLGAERQKKLKSVMVYLDKITSCKEGILDWVDNVYLRGGIDWGNRRCEEIRIWEASSAEELHRWLRDS